MSKSCVMRVMVLLLTPVLAFQGHTRTEFESDIAMEAEAARQDTSTYFQYCAPAWGMHTTSQLEATFGSYGNFGYGFDPTGSMPTQSFVTPPGSGIDYLFGGAVWIGGVVDGDTLVSVGADGWQITYEMHPAHYPDHGSVEDIYGYEPDSWRAEYTDSITYGVRPDWFGRPHMPLPVDIAMRSHSWDTEEFDDIIIYDMTITNIGSSDIEAGYVGLYLDADVCYDCGATQGYADDLTGSLRDERIGYIIDNDGDLSGDGPTSRIIALKLLDASFAASDTNYNWWVSNGTPALDFGPRQKGTTENPLRDFRTGGTGTPEGDVNKYYIMSFPEWDYDQVFTCSIEPTDPVWLYPDESLFSYLCDGGDTRFLYSVGPFDLPAGHSERIIFAMFTADSVHTDPGILSYLPDDPEGYLAALDFTYVRQNAAWADSLVDSLTDPSSPVIGLRVQSSTDSSVTVQWDPWCFDDVVGYEVYVSEVPPGDLPYPGVGAPWLAPATLELEAVVDAGDRSYRFDDLDPEKMYFVNVAHQTTTLTGDPGHSIIVQPGGRRAAPDVACEYVFAHESEPAILQWSEPPGVDIDHYNVYRFADSASADHVFHAFYDEGCMASYILPVDSFQFPMVGRTYYYYAIEPCAQPDSAASEYSDPNPIDNGVYYVSAVSKGGFESHFSGPVMFHEIEERTRDVLVITHSGPSSLNFVAQSTVSAFYDTVLDGHCYDIYDFYDSTRGPACPSGQWDCVDWHDFMRYKLVLVDDGLTDLVLTNDYETPVRGFTRYLLSGGRLAYFGQFNAYTDVDVMDEAPGWQSAGDDFIDRFFGIDSVFYVGLAYCGSSQWPCSDSLTGLSTAEGVAGEGLPDLAYDTGRLALSGNVTYFWPAHSSPPATGVFGLTDKGETTHLFRSLYPGQSLAEGLPIGVHTVTDEAETYVFGFHLWYMDYGDARSLIESFLPCCKGIRGNIDSDCEESIDISDVVYLVDYMFREDRAPGCWDEADVNGDGEPLLDITDLMHLVDYMFLEGPEPLPCP